VAKQVLRALRIELGSWVCALGGVSFPEPPGSLRRIAMRAERSDVSCPDERAAQKMRAAIDAAKAQGDTLGGVIRLFAEGLVPGLGSHVQWDQRLDMRIAGALMSIQAIKGVEFGLGFAAAALPGSQVHDPIAYRSGKGFYRDTNHAGGVEGGMTTGEPLQIQMAMKPIATLKQPLPSVHLRTKRPLAAGYERSDVCAVPAAAVVGEAMLAMELLKVVQEKFGGDTLRELRVRYQENQKNV
jgi:chorismate synthase